MKERTIWIDYLKVIGIWLVVLGHRDLLDTDYTQLIYCFHMPLFFVISGYLAGDSSFRQSVMKETNRLLMPFIATSTILLLIEGLKWVLVSVRHHDIALIVKNFLPTIYGSILGMRYGTESLHPVCAPLWFLITLFCVKSLHTMLYSIKWHVFAGVLCVFMSIILSYIHIQIVLPVVISVLAYPFFLLGTLLKQVDFKCVNSRMGGAKEWTLLSIAIILLIGTIVISNTNGRVEMAKFNLGNSPLLYYLASITGSFCLILLCRFLFLGAKLFDGIKVLSSGTMIILGFHLLLIDIIEQVFQLLGISTNTNVVGLIISMLVMVLSVPMINFTKRKFPILLGYRS